MERGVLARVHVLVVEDTDDSRELFETVLRYGGALVTSAASVEEAKQVLQTLRPHVILSDIAMPGDGFTLVQAARDAAAATGLEIPTVAVTAPDRLYSEERLRRAGFAAQLYKPVDPSELCRVVAAAARRE